MFSPGAPGLSYILWTGLCSQPSNLYGVALTSGSSECGLMCNWALCRGNHLLYWIAGALAWCPYDIETQYKDEGRDDSDISVDKQNQELPSDIKVRHKPGRNTVVLTVLRGSSLLVAKLQNGEIVLSLSPFFVIWSQRNSLWCASAP